MKGEMHMFNIKWNGNQVTKETTSGLFKKEIGYNEQVMKEQEKLKVMNAHTDGGTSSSTPSSLEPSIVMF